MGRPKAAAATKVATAALLHELKQDMRALGGTCADRAPQKDNDAGTDEAGDQIANPATERDAKQSEQPIR
jgi:hypothetical protein